MSWSLFRRHHGGVDSESIWRCVCGMYLCQVDVVGVGVGSLDVTCGRDFIF